MDFEVGDLVEHIEFKFIGKITDIVENDLFHLETKEFVMRGLIAHIDVTEKGRHGDCIPNKTTSFVGNIKKVYQVSEGETMNKDKLRLIEMQDIASVARNDMGNYRRVQNWGYNDKIALIASVSLIALVLGVVLL